MDRFRPILFHQHHVDCPSGILVHLTYFHSFPPLLGFLNVLVYTNFRAPMQLQESVRRSSKHLRSKISGMTSSVRQARRSCSTAIPKHLIPLNNDSFENKRSAAISSNSMSDEAHQIDTIPHTLSVIDSADYMESRADVDIPATLSSAISTSSIAGIEEISID